MKLVQGWRHAWRWWSVRLNLLGLSLLVAEQALPTWNLVPFEARAMLPPVLTAGLPITCFVLATIARVIRQERQRNASRSSRD